MLTKHFSAVNSCFSADSISLKGIFALQIVALTLSPVLTIEITFFSSKMLIFNFLNSFLIVFTMIFSSFAKIVGRYSNKVTSDPNWAKILANSHPITPPPITIKLFGASLKPDLTSNISLLSKIRL